MRPVLLIIMLSGLYNLCQISMAQSGPSLEVLQAAHAAGNGRATLMLYERTKEEDLTLAAYYVRAAFKDGTPGANAAFIDFSHRAGTLQSTQPNPRAGTIIAMKVMETVNADAAFPELSVYEWPHLAVTLKILGFYDGDTPEMGVSPSQRSVQVLRDSAVAACNDLKARRDLRLTLQNIRNAMVCDHEVQTCAVPVS